MDKAMGKAKEAYGALTGDEALKAEGRAEQRKAVDPALDRAASAIMTWIDKGINAAMNQFNAAETKDDL